MWFFTQAVILIKKCKDGQSAIMRPINFAACLKASVVCIYFGDGCAVAPLSLSGAEKKISAHAQKK